MSSVDPTAGPAVTIAHQAAQVAEAARVVAHSIESKVDTLAVKVTEVQGSLHTLVRDVRTLKQTVQGDTEIGHDGLKDQVEKNTAAIETFEDIRDRLKWVMLGWGAGIAVGGGATVVGLLKLLGVTP